MVTPPSLLPRALVLVGNPHSGHIKDGLERARQAITREGLRIAETIHMHQLDRLRSWVERPAAEQPLIVAAGGDGTVGAVCNYVANTATVLGILPLGTSNDVARSFDVPVGIEDAVHLLTTGRVATADLGQFVGAGEKTHYFVHAATMGIDVAFARLATRASWRKRLGRLSYAAAAVVALRDKKPFTCQLYVEGRRITLCLLHLSVQNAPIFGGHLELRLPGSNVDDRRLDVLAIDDVPLHRLLFAVIPLLLRRHPHVGGVRIYHVRRLRIHVEHALDVGLDGEVAARIPGEFTLAPEALRVVVGPRFQDIDD